MNTLGGKEIEAGFTLLELVAVLAIIGILATIALPTFTNAVQRAREAVLRENLFFMRDAIDQFYLDHERYPRRLRELVTKGYLRDIPDDPMTGEKNWNLIREEYEDMEDPYAEPGIWDVKSRSRERGLDRTRYNTW